MSMTEKIWTPGMLCDETTPEGTLVRMNDILEEELRHWCSLGKLAHHPIGGKHRPFRWIHPESGSTGCAWGFAVVVDENGKCPEDVLAREIRRVKGGPDPVAESAANGASLVGIAGDHRDQPLYQSILDRIDAHDSATRGERADRVYAEAMRMIGGG